MRFLNPVAERLLGWRGRADPGAPVEQVLTLVDEVAGQPAMNPVLAVLAQRAGRAGDGPAYCYRAGRRPAPPLPIEGEASPVLDPGGRLTGVVLVWRSVAERKRAGERAAERSPGSIN